MTTISNVGSENTTPAGDTWLEGETAGGLGEHFSITELFSIFGTLLNAWTAKTTLVDADQLALADSAASNVVKKITWANVMVQAAAYAQTLTNKILTSPVINSPTGIGTTIYTVKAANETVNNSNALQNDDHFSFAIAANEKWFVELDLLMQSPSATSDYQYDFTVPSGCTAYYGTDANQATANALWGGISAGSAPAVIAQPGTAVPVGSANGIYAVSIKMTVINGSTAGTVQYRWAQNTATSEDTIELANSIMKRTRLA